MELGPVNSNTDFEIDSRDPGRIGQRLPGEVHLGFDPMAIQVIVESCGRLGQEGVPGVYLGFRFGTDPGKASDQLQTVREEVAGLNHPSGPFKESLGGTENPVGRTSLSRLCLEGPPSVLGDQVEKVNRLIALDGRPRIRVSGRGENWTDGPACTVGILEHRPSEPKPQAEMLMMLQIRLDIILTPDERTEGEDFGTNRPGQSGIRWKGKVASFTC